MRHGFIKVAAATPDIRVADVDYNKGQIIKQMDEAAEAGAKIIVFPELCITGYTCSDLFLQDILLNSAKKALVEIAEHTKNLDALVFVGVPIAVGGELYNVAAALNHGNILGFTTKSFLPNYGEFYEMRQFRPGPKKAEKILFGGKEIPFGPQLLFVENQMADGKYPFLEYIEEPDKEKKYKKASDCGWYDPHNNFLIGDSGGFLLNIRPGKFVNTELFNEAARTYQATGRYTQFKVDSIPHRQFRRRECDRRRNGFSAPCWQNPDGSIEDVWITGGHYNFLNYTRMERTDESSVIVTEHGATAKKIYSFPSFIDAQFWTWQIIEFCRRNGLHLIIDKTRRGGFSYIMAADSSNEVNLSKHKVVIHVAADNKYLIKQGGLSDFAVNNLKFFEEKTPFKRGIFSPTTDSFKLGYRMKNGVEADDSWSSSLLSVSANNNPDCAIGKDAVTIKVEELSTMQNFDEFMNVTEPTMTVGTRTTGTLMAWGTATAANMQIFEQNFYNPRAFRFMAFENVFDNDARNEVCGFFKSYAWGLEGEIDGVKGFDENGNSNLRIGLQLAARERIEKKKTAKTFAEYLNYLGQRALFPSHSSGFSKSWP